MTTPAKDLAAGESLARMYLLDVVVTVTKMPTQEARVRFWMGFFSALGGAAMKDVGSDYAALALQAAAQAVAPKERP